MFYFYIAAHQRRFRFFGRKDPLAIINCFNYKKSQSKCYHNCLDIVRNLETDDSTDPSRIFDFDLKQFDNFKDGAQLLKAKRRCIEKRKQPELPGLLLSAQKFRQRLSKVIDAREDVAALLISTGGCITQVYYITNLYSEYGTVNEVTVEDEGPVTSPVVSFCVKPETLLLFDQNSTLSQREDEYLRLLNTPAELLRAVPGLAPSTFTKNFFLTEATDSRSSMQKSFRQNQICYDVHSHFKNSRQKSLWGMHLQRNMSLLDTASDW